VKGMILAGGRGTRLYPATLSVNKHMLAVFDKPMIYYPLSILMMAGLREILVISTPKGVPAFTDLLGDGGSLGLRIEYATQEAPRGIAEALRIGETFIGGGDVCLVLGDNVLFGDGLPGLLSSCVRHVETQGGAAILGYPVCDAHEYGVVEVGPEGEVRSLEEKPDRPKSNLAVPGVYFYDGGAVDIARGLRASSRGELEITHVNRAYLERGELVAKRIGPRCTWFDAGTHHRLLECSARIAATERRESRKIGCIEEIAYRQGFIDAAQLHRLAAPLAHSSYREYLRRILENAEPVDGDERRTRDGAPSATHERGPVSGRDGAAPGRWVESGERTC